MDDEIRICFSMHIYRNWRMGYRTDFASKIPWGLLLLSLALLATARRIHDREGMGRNEIAWKGALYAGICISRLQLAHMASW